jgi:hypothetical protein
MRVLIATDSYKLGGNWTVLESIVESLTKRNIETTMYYGSNDAGQLMFDHFEKNNLFGYGEKRRKYNQVEHDFF